MEIVNNYIKVFDNVLDKGALEAFTKICKNNIKYSPSAVLNADGSQRIDPSVRNVMGYTLSNINDSSLTNAHWASFFLGCFSHYLKEYNKNFDDFDLNVNINDMQVLKYSEGGHYKFHIDDGPSAPRTMSFIYFVNDNYEGGNLNFRLLESKKMHVIEKVSNRLIIWPSNFMFPHAVNPVTKGERFSVVAWAR